MTGSGFARVVLWASSTCVVLTPAFGQAPAGMIEELRGDVILQSISGPGPGTKLDARANGRLLYADEILVCGPGGSARVHVNNSIPGRTGDNYLECGKGKPRIEFKRGATEGPPRAEAPSAEEVLHKYKIAGRDKGSDSPIYDPPDGAAVAADGFVVHWRTRPPLGPFMVILCDDAGRELARAAAVDPAAGRLDSSALRQAVAEYRNSSATQRSARLLFQSDSGAENGVTFTILTKEQEQALRNALAPLKPPAGISDHLERSAIFESMRMYGAVAAEFDAALELAPESLDLLRAAVAVHSKIGNLRRARELRDRLQELESAGPDGKQ